MKITIRIIILIFTLSGILHLVNPAAFLWLMPPWLPEPILLIYLSGIFELICAAGLLFKQRWAGWLTALTLLAIWPANIWFAFSVSNSTDMAVLAAAWLRLPLQLPLIYYSVKFARAEPAKGK